MPKPLGGHNMIAFGKHAVAVIGGQSSNYTLQDEIHIFKHYPNGTHNWTTIRRRISVPRSFFTAVEIPNDIINCAN